MLNQYYLITSGNKAFFRTLKSNNRILPFLAIAIILLTTGCSEDNELITESGFKYEFLENVDGESCQPGDFAFFHVKMTADDSVLFDTHVSPGEPTAEQIPVEGAQTPGNMEPIYDVLKQMSPGDSLKLYFPTDSFQTKPPQLAAFDEVQYELVLTDIKDAEGYGQWLEEKKAEQAALEEAGRAKAQEIGEFVDEVYGDYKAGSLDDEITRLPSGLGILIHEEGTGPMPEQGEVVITNYYGVLADSGEMFDNSYKRGTEFPFALGQGQVIRGWDEGFAQLKVGTKATLFIPSHLGYGERGSGRIAPNSDLVFYVELVGIQ